MTAPTLADRLEDYARLFASTHRDDVAAILTEAAADARAHAALRERIAAAPTGTVRLRYYRSATVLIDDDKQRNPLTGHRIALLPIDTVRAGG